MRHILIVDRDRQARTKLARALKSEGYRTTGIDNLDALPPTLAISKPDIVLLDVTLDAAESGFEACRSLRNWSSVPVLMALLSFDEKTKIQALDAGADDVLIKPFSIDALLACVRAIQRRLDHAVKAAPPVLQIGELAIDLASSFVRLRNEAIHLTRNEYKLLKALVAAEGKPVTYKSLLGSVYGRDGELKGQHAAIRGLIQQLRHKLNDDVRNPRYILTESRLGYRFNMNPRSINPNPEVKRLGIPGNQRMV